MRANREKPMLNHIKKSLYDQFMSFSIGGLIFIDSFQFTASISEKLVEHLNTILKIRFNT